MPSDVIPARFERYELFRIFLPGYLAAAFFFAYVFLFLESTLFHTMGEPYLLATFVILGALIGLFLYDFDYPRRRKFWEEALKEAPSSCLLRWCQQHPEAMPGPFQVKNADDATNLYFIILDGYAQPDIRERAYYFGSIYRVYSDMKLIFGVSGTVFFATLIAKALLQSSKPSSVNCKIFLQLAVTALTLLWFIYMMRNGKGDAHLRSTFRTQVAWLKTHEHIIRQVLSQSACSARSPVPPATPPEREN